MNFREAHKIWIEQCEVAPTTRSRNTANGLSPNKLDSFKAHWPPYWRLFQMLRSAIALLVCLICFFSSTESKAAPAKLGGNSLIVDWSETRVQRNVGEERFRSVAASHQFRVYISTTGRVFSRLTNTTRAGTGSADEVTGFQGARRAPAFSGQSLTIFIPSRGSGVRRLSINFDRSFDSCTADVIRAKPEGSGLMTGTSIITGRKLEIQSVTVGRASCTTYKGNIFGGEPPR